ncbi:family 7 glycoside hydrolase [Powellomyces hirtus]|nr:family 7 glycoside hydrolase [Powellomyces hirtus]
MRLTFLSLAAAALTAQSVSAQLAGTLQAERHPPLQVSTCSNETGCTTSAQSVVLDANWRWTNKAGTNCYTGNQWNAALCPDPKTCAQNCALEGADYGTNYGVSSSADSLTLKFVTKHPYGTNVGSRVYLMDKTNEKYQMLKLKNKEFAFDVDVSNLPCGLNGALYFVEMDADGGMAKYPTNKAGAKYGTGYCDAQCPHDVKFIAGEANTIGWTAGAGDPNSGKGKYGSCCIEMDIWEANKISTAYTPHSCKTVGPVRCDDPVECGDGANRHKGICDKDGCDFNPFRMGDTTFYGPGKTVDTLKPMTVITQFITVDGTDTGALKEIRRLYVQNGKVINNSHFGSYDSVSDTMCAAQKKLFEDPNEFANNGGMKNIADALDRGMTLVMSIWDDHDANMLWLDSSYPPTKPVTAPGVTRGSCDPSSGKPADVEANFPNSSVKFSNIKWGEIGSTYAKGSTPQPPTAPTPPTPAPTTAPGNPGTNCAGRWAQCGGTGYTGPTCCVTGTTCNVVNQYYHQCQ